LTSIPERMPMRQFSVLRQRNLCCGGDCRSAVSFCVSRIVVRIRQSGLRLPAKNLIPLPFLAIGIGTFFVYQVVSIGSPLCFDDCAWYTPLMGLSWPNYYHMLLAMSRSWTVPVFFSLFGSYSLTSAKVIVMAQTYIQFFAWILFAASLRRFFHGRMVGRIALVLVGSLMFSQGYYHTNQFLLSDSLALSSVLLQWAACLTGRGYLQWARQQRHARSCIALYVLALALLTAIAMGTRDANIMLALAGIVFVVLDTRAGLLTIRPLVILIVLVGLTTAGEALQAQHRHVIMNDAGNLLAGFVLPDSEARRYFVDHGMPQALADLGPGLRKQEFGNARPTEILAQRDRITPAAAAYLGQFDRVYGQYLLSHLDWVASTAFANRNLIFEQEYISSDSAGTAPPVAPEKPMTVIIGPSIHVALTDLLPFEFWVVIFCLCLAGTVALAGWRRAGLPVLLGALGVANALGGFFADLWEPNEMARHAFIGSIVLRIGIMLALALLLDAVGDRIAAGGAGRSIERGGTGVAREQGGDFGAGNGTGTGVDGPEGSVGNPAKSEPPGTMAGQLHRR
jgi:hypothetical protein